MAPKAKQQAQSAAQPKAKAEPKADAKAKAKAEPKAKAKAEAAVAKPAAAAPPAPKADPKAEAKAKAKADAKSKAKEPVATPAPAAAKADAKAKAKQTPKSQPAAPAPAAKAVEQPSAKSKSKAKGKAKAEPTPPPPEPEPIEEEEAKKKKKTNHRGGRNKNKEETGPWPEDEAGSPAAAPVSAAPKKGKSAADLASKAAEQDPELRALRQRLSAIDGDDRSKKRELESLLKDLEKEMTSKLASLPHKSKHAANVSSTQIEQSLRELQDTKTGVSGISAAEREDFVQACKKELEEARAHELWNAVKTKLQELKAQCEEKLKATSPSAPAAVTATKGEGRGDNSSAPRREEGDGREAAMLRRLGNLHKEDASGSKTVTKTFDLDVGITKYLFSAPHNFNGRFEQQYKVLVESVRGPKGGGKGGKGAAPPKEVTLIGLKAEEVNECEKALKALDFSGTKTKDIENGIVMPSNNQKAVLEKEFNVFIFKSQTQLTVFGAGKNVTDALAKIEDEGYSKAVTVSADLVKIIYAQRLMDTWKAGGQSISLNQPGGKDSQQPAKITIQGKSKADTEEIVAKVEAFVTNTGTETVSADTELVAKLFNRANTSWLAKRFKDIQESCSDVSIKKANDGMLLIGPKSKLGKVKVELRELLQKASYEPVKVSLDSDQVRVFSKETQDRIRDSSGLIELYRGSEKDDANGGARLDVLVLLGDAASVGKAQTEIQEVIKNEGAVETIQLSDYACKELLVSKGAKIQEIQNKHSTRVDMNRKTNTVKIFGSVASVEATKKSIQVFAKKIDSVTTKSLTLEPDQIGRVIGKQGSTLQSIRKECNVQVTVDNNNPIVELRGDAKGIEQAERMIDEVLGKVEPAEPKPKAKKGESAPADEEPAEVKPKPKGKAKAVGYEGNAAQDFPSLGGVPAAKAKPAAKAWGKNQAEDSTPAKEEAPEKAYPTLGAAKAPVVLSAADYKLPAEPVVEAAAPVVEAKEEKAEEEKANEPEEEAAGDMDDPFAMMGGMGEEEVYKVTMMPEAEKDADAEA